MKKFSLMVVSLVFILNLGCKENKKTSVESESNKMEQVMAVHDEVMPKMGKIGRLVAELKKKIDTDLGGAAEKKAMEDLQEAHKTMMDWMKGFGDRFDSDEIMNGKELSSEKKQWLDEEEEKVKVVKEKINSSIANAEALLKE